MTIDEDIFDKPQAEKPIKPKRKLTDKQLENLKKGRERMALKRAETKAKKDAGEEIKKEKKIIKVSDKCAKEGQKKKTKDIKEKRKTMKQINEEKEKQILLRLEKQEQDKQNKKQSKDDLFTSLKVKCLDKAKDINEYKSIKNALDGIDEDTLHDDKKLRAYAKNVMSSFNKTNKTKDPKLESIKEENNK